MKEPGTKATTIDDIARAAGVSKTTVSRYINGKYSMMSEETRKRIEAIIQMSNYHPNSIAQSLKTRQSHQVGVVISDISSPFSVSLIRGIGHVLLEAGYVPLFVDCNDDSELERRLIQTLMARRVDGLLVNTTNARNPFLIQLACQGTPIVLCDRYVEDYKFSFVGSDFRVPTLRLVEHLRDQGYEKAAFFTQDYSTNSTRALRHQAFLEAAALYYPKEEAEDLCFVIRPDDMDSTVEAVRRLRASCSPGRSPAIIAVNTMTTLHVIAAIQATGLSIPDQIGVCGPDDWGWDDRVSYTQVVTPSITSYKIRPYAIGSDAARLLLKQIQAPRSEKEEILIPAELVVRDSTRLRSGCA